jgi:hypothetical protein
MSTVMSPGVRVDVSRENIGKLTCIARQGIADGF